MNALPTRKTIRLQSYDYSQNGAYFITICTRNKRNLFWKSQVPLELTEFGDIAKVAIQEIEEYYSGVHVDCFVVMPNHVHILLTLNRKIKCTVSTIISQYKGIVTKRCGMKVWQGRFYDHVIRDENDYLKIGQYIENNPAKWQEVRYYVTP